MGHALLKRGISTPRPVAYYKGLGGSSVPSFLLTARLDQAVTLEDGVKPGSDEKNGNRRGHSALIRTLSESLGRLVGRMHAWHFRHRNLGPCDLGVVPGAEKPVVHLIDIDQVRLVRQLSEKGRAADLARMSKNFARLPGNSRTARLRFLRAYLAELPQPNGDWKKLWHLIARLG
jgi:hypothetical protein